VTFPCTFAENVLVFWLKEQMHMGFQNVKDHRSFIGILIKWMSITYKIPLHLGYLGFSSLLMIAAQLLIG
jgi:hypothetical protein